MPIPYRWLLRLLVLLQIGIVSWDALSLMEKYGLRRVQFDGMDYLRMTHSLLRGEGLRSTPIFEPASYRWINEWPLGYPALIAAASKLTGEEPFYVSRWLNVLLYALCYLCLLFFFRAEAELLFLVLWPPNFTWSIGMILSENLFLPLWICTVGCIYRYYASHRVYWLGFLFFTLPALFLVRYTGLATGAALGIWGMWNILQGKRREGFLFIGSAAVQSLFAFVYFTWNHLQDPAGASGLELRNMPMPADWLWRTLEEITFLRYAGGVLIGAALLTWLRQREVPQKIEILLLLMSFTQGALYLWSMNEGRVGIVDQRHFVLILLPSLWVAWKRIFAQAPAFLLVGIGGGMLLWQGRNTYQHTLRSSSESYLPYKHLKAVQKAYDTLPPNTCIIGGNHGYPIIGARLDLCLGDGEAYWPLLLRSCDCFYIDCGAVETRHRIGLMSHILWPFVKFCHPPCKEPICLRKIRCENSP
ncbi:MAG: hypothetical protein N2170_09690 [Bacteroidia bacterium]|nr:hypothetical protein [Bacteroidia bacterium]